MPTATLHEGVQIGLVQIRVSNLERSLAFTRMLWD